MTIVNKSVSARSAAGPPAAAATARGNHDAVAADYLHHSAGQRVNTDAVVAEALRKQYPDLRLTITPTQGCDLLAFAQAGYATAVALEDAGDALSGSLKWQRYIPPVRRQTGTGVLVEQVHFGKFAYAWEGHEVLLYVVSGRDGGQAYPTVVNNYILSSAGTGIVDRLMVAVSRWIRELQNEVWVFDEGYWQKSTELFESVQKARWEDVILDEELKKTNRDDVQTFCDAKETYERLRVPWKRGLIYYGPPGNGKTISIKATMHSLYDRDEPVPTLYVRTLASYGPSEFSLKEIFTKARQEAPCLLVFEDLDTIVTDGVRSYFLNQVDGLAANDGILMIGSTNHLERLDPGISKRPSRFDRKLLFPQPNLSERIAYSRVWQKKLASNPDIEFPDELCIAIARATDDFSFAYIQEAFVAALLTIATNPENNIQQHWQEDSRYSYSAGSARVFGNAQDADLDVLRLWIEIQKQIKILWEGMESD